MNNLIRCNSDNKDFQNLVKELDIDLAIRDGDDHAFYHQFNKINSLQHVIVAYESSTAVGCGAIKEFSSDTMEIKRMFVLPQNRGKGIASLILTALETWSLELNHQICILETGKMQPEAIRLYEKNNYFKIPNYGQYTNIENSLCFKKYLIKQ